MIAKFRPLLSANDVAVLIAGLDMLPSSVQKEATRKKLALFQRKVELGMVTASSYVKTTAGTGGLAADLGVSEEEKAKWLEEETKRLLGDI